MCVILVNFYMTTIHPEPRVGQGIHNHQILSILFEVGIVLVVLSGFNHNELSYEVEVHFVIILQIQF